MTTVLMIYVVVVFIIGIGIGLLIHRVLNSCKRSKNTLHTTCQYFMSYYVVTDYNWTMSNASIECPPIQGYGDIKKIGEELKKSLLDDGIKATDVQILNYQLFPGGES